MSESVYAAIDLKSFYASVECMERGLDPLKTHLVVADTERSEKTICLAVSPSLKSYGIPGRARLFEIIEKVRFINAERAEKAPGRRFTGSSVNEDELRADPSLKLDYIAAVPQMAHYMDISAKIYATYLRFISEEDIHVYSIDEVFIDLTKYLRTYALSPHDLTMMLIREVLRETGITAAAGIGPNLYLAKVAMDIEAKHIPADPDGVRIAELSERSYREKLWDHRPLRDFWRIGKGIAKKLEEHGLYTMGDVARCSLGDKSRHFNEDLLYSLFGVNAQLLIDHAWGWEPCTIADIKAYKPENNSISTGQVLKCGYTFEQGRTVVFEMADRLALDLVEKKLVTDRIDLSVGYDIAGAEGYEGPMKKDYYGREAPKMTHGGFTFESPTASGRKICDAALWLYEQYTHKDIPVRRFYIGASHVLPEAEAARLVRPVQPDLFTDYEALAREKEADSREEERERKLQESILEIQQKFGKNAILKGASLQDEATARERNRQIGGHKA